MAVPLQIVILEANVDRRLVMLLPHRRFSCQERSRMTTPKVLRVAEVAERLNCSASTAYSLIENGKLGHHRCPGVRVSEEQLAAYLEVTKQERQEPTPCKRTTHRPRIVLRHL